MTLTHVLPSLRRTLPDPLDPDLWPRHTSARCDDVLVAGVSMRRLVELCETPCVHAADGRTVILTRVEASATGPDGIRELWLDAELENCDAQLSGCRLLGRVSTARDALTLVRPYREPPALVWLGSDIGAGDVLAIPARGELRVGCLRRPDLDPARCGR